MPQNSPHGPEGGFEAAPLPLPGPVERQKLVDTLHGRLQDRRHELRAQRALGGQALVAVGPSENYVEYDDPNSGDYPIEPFSNN